MNSSEEEQQQRDLDFIREKFYRLRPSSLNEKMLESFNCALDGKMLA
jgi:hypothetical protein